jgi:hypothetical protein
VVAVMLRVMKGIKSIKLVIQCEYVISYFPLKNCLTSLIPLNSPYCHSHHSPLCWICLSLTTMVLYFRVGSMPYPPYVIWPFNNYSGKSLIKFIPGPNGIRLFTSAMHECSCKAIVFVTGRPF